MKQRKIPTTLLNGMPYLERPTKLVPGSIDSSVESQHGIIAETVLLMASFTTESTIVPLLLLRSSSMNNGRAAN